MTELYFTLAFIYVFIAGVTIPIAYEYQIKDLGVNLDVFGEVLFCLFLSILSGVIWITWVPFYLTFKLLSK